MPGSTAGKMPAATLNRYRASCPAGPVFMMNNRLDQGSDTRRPQPARKPLLCTAAFVAVAVLGSVWLHHAFKKPLQRTALSSNPPSVSAQQIIAGAHSKPEAADLREAGEIADAPRESAPLSSPVQSIEPAQPPGPRTEPTLLTRQLISSLSQIDLSRGIAVEQAAAWRETIQQLVQQGSAGVAAIREFLELNQDISFTGVQGGEWLGHPSLRRALFNALQQIGGEEALAVSLQVLQTTGAPSEIALLARYVEQQAPGQYRPEIFKATRETLAMAAAGQLNEGDVGPLFQVFQTYGDAGIVPDLEVALTQWRYYATMTLAEMQSGEGIPALIGLAQDTSANDGGNRTFV